MAFKSYSWAIGTTSFRTSQLNYKIERQLQLLKEFWNNNPGLNWNNDTQEKYYNFLKEYVIFERVPSHRPLQAFQPLQQIRG